MAGDFNKPSGSSLKANFMTEIRDNQSELGKMSGNFSNKPTGLIKRNSTTKRLEEWNGSAWVAADLTGIVVALANTLLANGSARTATNAPAANNIPVLDASGNLKLPGNVVVPNAAFYMAKDAGGTERSVAVISADNFWYFGDTSHVVTGFLVIDGSGASALKWSPQAGGIYAIGHSGLGYPQPGTGGETLKRVRGLVNSDGTIAAGTGFTVSRTSTGTYQIDVSTAFSAIFSVNASHASIVGYIKAVPSTSSRCYIYTYNLPGSLADAQFNFSADGPA